MKKNIIIIIITLVLALILTACSKAIDNENKIYVLATAIPHEEILIEAKPLLEELGYELIITVTDDYYVPNQAVANKSVDANFFQHIPFLTNYNSTATEDKKLVNVGNIHIEPIAGYSKNIVSLDELKEGNHKVLISNSEADHGRILSILVSRNIIVLNEGVDTLTAKLSDIKTKPEGLEFRQVAPELLVTSYNAENDISLAFINGNYALEAGLLDKEKVIVESPNNNPYVNVVAVLNGREDLPKIKALISVLKSEEIKNFIINNYGGSVIPA